MSPPAEDTKGDSSGPDFLMDASAVVMELGLSMQKVPMGYAMVDRDSLWFYDVLCNGSQDLAIYQRYKS
jgi:hypothetical protein